MPAEAVSKPEQEYFLVPNLPKDPQMSPELERMRAELEEAKASGKTLKWHSHLRERVDRMLGEKRMRAMGLEYDPHTRPVIEYRLAPGLPTEPTEEPSQKSTKKPTKKSIKEPAKKTAKEPTKKPAEGPAEGSSQAKETHREPVYDVDEWGRWREQ